MAKRAYIVSVYYNTNAKTNPVSVRFISENDLPNNLKGVNRMVVDSSVKAASTPKPLTRLFPVSEEVFDGWNLGIISNDLPVNGKDPFIFDEPIDGEKLYGYPVGIQVVEKTVPEYAGQECKINPTTKKPMTHQGMPIFRHHIVQPLEDCGPHILLEADKAI